MAIQRTEPPLGLPSPPLLGHRSAVSLSWRKCDRFRAGSCVSTSGVGPAMLFRTAGTPPTPPLRHALAGQHLNTTRVVRLALRCRSDNPNNRLDTYHT